MPEGDTIFKLAAHLGPALQGRELLPDSAVAGVRADLAGRRRFRPVMLTAITTRAPPTFWKNFMTRSWPFSGSSRSLRMARMWAMQCAARSTNSSR